MLLAHARVLAQARSYLAALADTATTFDASLEYDRVLLELDAIHGDHTPALYAVAATESATLYAAAEAAIEAVAEFGVDALRVELLLAALEDARGLDRP
jgi:hypothetical protein